MATLPEAWVGVNFWSRVGGPFMWRSFDEAVVREELQTLADHSLTMTRSFFFWPDFHPKPYQIDDEKCALFARFLDLHVETGLRTIPTFIVGHMSGQNWDPAWRNDRDLYGDVWMVGRQAWFLQEMTRRFAEHPAVAVWLISNESDGVTGSRFVGRLWDLKLPPAEAAAKVRAPIGWPGYGVQSAMREAQA